MQECPTSWLPIYSNTKKTRAARAGGPRTAGVLNARAAPPMPVHAVLELLERYVRRPCEGSLLDRCLFMPAKMAYLDLLKEEHGYRRD